MAKAKAKKKLVGGSKGAWAHAKEQAKGKRDPDAYAAKVYSLITKKSCDAAAFHTKAAAKLFKKEDKTVSKSAAAVLQDYLLKSQHGEGSHGGHVIGHTKSGKPVYAKLDGHNHGYSHFSASDHRDAARMHRDKRVSALREVRSRRAANDANATENMGAVEHHGYLSRTHEHAATRVPDFIKSQHGEGSRGGHIIGHTRSGKPIYANQHSSYTNRHGGLSVSATGGGAAHAGHASYTAQDHEDAAIHHRKLAKLHERASVKTAEDFLGQDPSDVHDDRHRSLEIAEDHHNEADQHTLAAHGMRNKQFFTGSHVDAAAKHRAAEQKIKSSSQSERSKWRSGVASPWEEKVAKKALQQIRYHRDMADMHNAKAKVGA